jgi:DIS3-like exonuclease 2
LKRTYIIVYHEKKRKEIVIISVFGSESRELITMSAVDEAVIRERIAKGELFSGTLTVFPKKRKIAYVKCKNLSVDICIEEESLRGRSFHSDIVAVELLPTAQWLAREVGDATPEPEFKKFHVHVDEEMQQSLWQPSRFDPSKLPARRNTFSTSPCTTSSSSSSSPVSRATPMHPMDDVAKRGNLQPTGRVVFVLEKLRPKKYIGTLGLFGDIRENAPMSKTDTKAIFKPSNVRYPHMIVNRSDLPAAFIADPFNQQNQIYSAELCSYWPEASKMAFVNNVVALGEAGTIEVETIALLMENNLEHGDFSQEMLLPLYRMLGLSGAAAHSGGAGRKSESGWAIPPEEISRRVDLRKTRIFTIDPPNAKDLDDAMHVTLLADGTYEIGVHIADVSYFLDEGSLLDGEAKKRATSIYLVQKVIPMLPPLLCEELCSLNPNVDRLAFSCIWRMNEDGTLVSGWQPWYGRTVIRSCAKLDYYTAQRMITGEIPSTPSSGSDADSFLTGISDAVWPLSRRPVASGNYRQFAWEIARDVCLLNRVAMNRRALRFANGALVLTHPKLTFERDPVTNQPINFAVYQIQNSNQLIEEYMLLANYLVAQELLIKCGNAAFLRNHPVVDGESRNFKDLISLANKLNLEINFENSQGLQESIRRLSSMQDADVAQVVTSVLLHQMKLATYMVAGDCSEEEWRHFALNIPYYTHFTSPIRRYADVMVHRQLFLALTQPEEAASLQHDDAKVGDFSATAEQCNTMKLASKTAQERSDTVYLSMYLVNNPRHEYGVVIGIGEKSFTVLIDSIFVEERFFVDKMPHVQSSFDKAAGVLKLSKVTKGSRQSDMGPETSASSTAAALSTLSVTGKKDDGKKGSYSSSSSQPNTSSNSKGQQKRDNYSRAAEDGKEGNKRRDRNPAGGGAGMVTVEPELLALQHLQDFDSIEISLFTKVRVYVTGRKRPPVGVVAMFVGLRDDEKAPIPAQKPRVVQVADVNVERRRILDDDDV